jgi:predicted P-loop ATPase/GTPase
MLVLTLSFLFLKDKSLKDTLNETIRSVIENELNVLTQNAKIDSIESYNENFLKANSKQYERVIEVAKLTYDLNPAQNQKKALDLLTNIKDKNYSINLEVN